MSLINSLILLSIFVNGSSEIQKPLILKDSIYDIQVGSFLSLFEDTTDTLSYDVVSEHAFSRNFKKVKQITPNLGFSKSAFWFKCSIIDSSTLFRDWILDIAIPSLHAVNFFVSIDDSILIQKQSGFTVDRNSRCTPFRNPSVEFNSIPGKPVTIYIQIKSETPVLVPVFLREKSKYIQYDRNREFMLGIYFGALLIMIIYHFYLFILTRDKSYLWLTLFTFCFGFGQMSAVYGFLTDWGVTQPSRYLKWLHLINFIAAFFAIVLSREMILSKKYSPSCDIVLKILQISTIVFTPISLWMSFEHSENLLLLFNILPIPFLVCSSIISYRKKHKPSLYYIFASSSFIAGIAIYNLMYGFSFLPFNTFFYFIPNITFIIMLSLFSIGLADKINILKNERENAHRQILLNISEKILLQEENTAVINELEQARKLATIGRVLSGVTHDINNFLNPIINYSILIKNKCQADVFLSKSVDNLVNATHQLKNLSLSLLDISKKKTQNISTVDINNAAKQIGSLLKHSCPTGISVKMNLSTQQMLITAEAGMIHSAILNVGLNAIDAMPNGGIVTISTDYSELAESSIIRKKFGIPEGLYIAVSIHDTGIGMDQQTICHIFEPFFTTNKNGKGIGLGLYEVYNCIKRHNGCIDIYSKPGEESRITLFFPKAEFIAEKQD